MVPEMRDFVNNPKYPGCSIYSHRFGGWDCALEKVGLLEKRKKIMPQLYTDKELLNYIIQFYKENDRVPAAHYFGMGDHRYPALSTYVSRFGSWSNVLKLIGLDVDSMVEKGILDNNQQKCRKVEIMIIKHFKQASTDLSGINQNSPYDGICPDGKLYDVKSSKFRGTGWLFNTRNEYKGKIDIYYFLAFNKDYTELVHGWKVPGEIIKKDWFYVGMSPSDAEFTLHSMKEYDYTGKLRDILNE